MKKGSDLHNDLPASPSAQSPRSSGRDVGVALRAAYQRTVEEAIPAEMLELLGKLR